MSWIISNGVLINKTKGTVFYPWDYKLQWDITSKQIKFIDADELVISKVFEYELTYKQLTTWQSEGQAWKGIKVTIDSDLLPGSDTYQLRNGDLTNGTVSIELAKCEVSDVDDSYFGLSFNDVRYLVKKDGEVQQHLVKLIDIFERARITIVEPSSDDVTPGSSDFLCFAAWVYSLLCIAGGVFLAKEGDVAIGVGIGVSSLLVLAFALAISKINDNLHKFLAGRK